jgi:hypothetical protein
MSTGLLWCAAPRAGLAVAERLFGLAAFAQHLVLPLDCGAHGRGEPVVLLRLAGLERGQRLAVAANASLRVRTGPVGSGAASGDTSAAGAEVWVPGGRTRMLRTASRPAAWLAMAIGRAVFMRSWVA